MDWIFQFGDDETIVALAALTCRGNKTKENYMPKVGMPLALLVLASASAMACRKSRQQNQTRSIESRLIQGTGDDDCWFGPERDANFLVRSVNLQQGAQRTTADFEEITRIAHADFGSVGLWLTQETRDDVKWCQRSNVDPSNPIHCLETLMGSSFGLTDVWSYKYDNLDYDLATFVHRYGVDAMTYLEDSRVLTFWLKDPSTSYSLKVYDIHGYHHCSEDHARHRRKEVMAIIQNLKENSNGILPAILAGDFNMSHKIGDWCKVGDVPQEGPGRIDDETVSILTQHFTLMSAPSWPTQKSDRCELFANGIDHLWIARRDVFPVRGELIPRYLKYTNIKTPGTEYCAERTRDCTANNHPSIPCDYCLSDHHLLTMAFEATCEPIACPSNGCGQTDGCGTACPCDQGSECREKCERKLESCEAVCEQHHRPPACWDACTNAYQTCVNGC